MKLALLSFVLAAAQNPFDGQAFYVNPAYQKELDTSIATASGTTKATLQAMRSIPSAYWIDVKAKIKGTTTDTLEGILQDAASKNQLATVILYDLPNRDCHAKASNGEICCTYNADRTCDYNAAGECSAGIKEYMTEYVDPFVAVVSQYASKIPVVVVVEPDSLPNLATNQGDPHCGNSATTAAYTAGITYAVKQLASQAPQAHIYVDAAHGGWLGWDDNLVKYAKAFAALGITNSVRGFATNVANYQPIGVQCPWVSQGSPTRNDYCLNGQHQSDPCCVDPCRLEGQWNPANNEMNYVAALARVMTTYGGFTPHFIIDSGRNGVGNMRSDCANWCNIRGAGAGLIPTAKTANTSLVDAYFWLKTPGESDGCTQQLPDGTSCPRFDSFCGSSDSVGSRQGEPRAPQAGQWFDYQVKMLADNAHLTI